MALAYSFALISGLGILNCGINCRGGTPRPPSVRNFKAGLATEGRPHKYT
jgi:hypothetical protein